MHRLLVPCTSKNKFIKTTVPKITDSEEVEDKFEEFWSDEKTKAFERMCNEEGLMTEKLQNLIDNYLYSGRKPRGDALVETLKVQPKILERASIVKKLMSKFNSFIETFIEGI